MLASLGRRVGVQRLMRTEATLKHNLASRIQRELPVDLDCVASALLPCWVASKDAFDSLIDLNDTQALRHGLEAIEERHNLPCVLVAVDAFAQALHNGFQHRHQRRDRAVFGGLRFTALLAGARLMARVCFWRTHVTTS